jgi:hypothetical protein
LVRNHVVLELSLLDRDPCLQIHHVLRILGARELLVKLIEALQRVCVMLSVFCPSVAVAADEPVVS